MKNIENFSREDLRNLRKKKVELSDGAPPLKTDETSTFDLKTEDQDDLNTKDQNTENPMDDLNT